MRKELADESIKKNLCFLQARLKEGALETGEESSVRKQIAQEKTVGI